jgi:hypothetical protein
VNETVPPLTCVGFAGATVIDVSVTGAPHVSVVLPVTDPTNAEIVLLAALRQLTNCVVFSAPKLATAEFPLTQVAVDVTFCVEPSL